MATRPKRRKRSTTSAEPTDSGDQPSPGIPQIDVEGMVQSCMSAITPTLEETFRQYMHNYHARGQVAGQQPTSTSTVVRQSTQQNEPSAAAGSEIIQPQPSLLQELTDSGGRVQTAVSRHGQQTHPSSSETNSPLSNTMNFLLRSSLSQSTISSYHSAFQTYKQFIVQTFGDQVKPLPPSLQHMSAFIAHCFLTNLAASTTRTLVSSLSFTFKLGVCEDITQHFIVKKMLQGYQKCQPSNDARLPITPMILQKLVNALDHTTSSPFIRALLRAMFILAFCAFLRVGEITKTGGTNQHYLKFGNIRLGQDTLAQNHVEINIQHFKHSKSNHTTLRVKENTSNTSLCSYRAMVHYLNLRKHTSSLEPLFSFIDGTPISRQYFTHQLQTTLAFCNLSLQSYHTHSFRIGAASTAASQGFTEIQIQNMGRWNSNAFRKYIRIPTLKL